MANESALVRNLARSERRLARLGYTDFDGAINVCHYAYFLRRRDAELFMAHLVDEGFEVACARAGIEHVVDARLPDARGDHDVSAAVRAVFHTVESLHGTYGGWDKAFPVDEPPETGLPKSAPEPNWPETATAQMAGAGSPRASSNSSTRR